jgi:probable rRNA maturation factor
MPAEVEVLNETGSEILEMGVVSLVRKVLAAEGVAGGVGVAFVDESVIASLNERYRDVDGPTDVLSFSEESRSDEWPSGFEPEPDRGEQAELGEILICPAVVSRYAHEESNPEELQLAWTLVHGVLHLLGYNHEVDRGEMRERERVLLASLQPVTRLLGPAGILESGPSDCRSA